MSQLVAGRRATRRKNASLAARESLWDNAAVKFSVAIASVVSVVSLAGLAGGPLGCAAAPPAKAAAPAPASPVAAAPGAPPAASSSAPAGPAPRLVTSVEGISEYVLGN